MLLLLLLGRTSRGRLECRVVLEKGDDDVSDQDHICRDRSHDGGVRRLVACKESTVSMHAHIEGGSDDTNPGRGTRARGSRPRAGG